MSTSRTTTTGNVSYRYVIGGEAFGVPHEAGDPVPPSVLKKAGESKVREWLKAGVIKPDKRRKES